MGFLIGKSISLASGARIQYPCNRTYPLSFYGHKIVGNQLHSQMLAGLRGPSPLNSPLAANAGFRFGGTTPVATQSTHAVLQHQQSLPTAIGQPIMQQQSPMSSSPRGKLNTAPRLPSKKQRSQSLTPAQAIVVSNMKNADAGNSADGIIHCGGPGSENVGNGGGSLNHLNHSNGHGFRSEGRRFPQFEKSNSVCSSNSENHLHSHLENLNMHGKIPTNGFQTIARCTANDVLDNHHIKFTTHSLPRPATNVFRNNLNRTSSLARDFNADSSASMLSSLEISKIPELPEKPPSPPPKPNRNGVQAPAVPRATKDVSSLEQQYPLQRQGQGGMGGIYQLSGSDSGNGSGDSMPGDMNEFIMHRGVVIKNPRFMTTSVSSVTLKSLSEFDVEAAEDQLFTLEIPEFKPVSYRSVLVIEI